MIGVRHATLSLAASLSAVLLIGTTTAGGKPDLAHGEQLHNTNCTECHGNMTGGDGSALYTRSQRLVHTMQQLESQVRRCASGLDLAWYDEDMADVVHYLNERYYRFGK
jgi:mono/diheme cytochrome c family protein